MDTFLQNIFTFPTVFFSGLLVLVVLYWLVASFGIADVDSLDMDVDLEADGEVSTGHGWLTKFKLDGIPLTITLSLIILVSWLLCFLAVELTFPLVSEAADWVRILLGFWFIVLTPVMAAVIISPLLQPLKPLFRKQSVTRAGDLVGGFAVIRSGKVTARFGEAETSQSGASLLVKIRADEPNDLKRGDTVVLRGYDVQQNTYQVIKSR